MTCPCICQRALAAFPSLGQQAARGQLQTSLMYCLMRTGLVNLPTTLIRRSFSLLDLMRAIICAEGKKCFALRKQCHLDCLKVWDGDTLGHMTLRVSNARNPLSLQGVRILCLLHTTTRIHHVYTMTTPKGEDHCGQEHSRRKQLLIQLLTCIVF